jgi:glucosamine-phosphate N-acetyltransferase
MEFLIRYAIWTDIPQVLECLKELNQDLPTDENLYQVWEEIVESNVRVIICTEKNQENILGVASYFIERKFIHNGGYVCHIEDVAVKKDAQGKGVGSALVKYIIGEAELSQCYKIILDCSEKNVLFYEKLDFNKSGIQMRYNCNERNS